MRIRVPVTGKVLDYDPVGAQMDGIGIVGDPNDPVRLIDINLGNVSWRLVTIDLENDLAEIEISPANKVSLLKAGGDPENSDDWTSRPPTDGEKQGFLDYAKSLVENRTKDELYGSTKSTRLVKTPAIVQLYKEKPPKKNALL